MSRSRVAVLASGGGSNFAAIVEHLDALGGDRAADVVLVVGDRPAGALDRARRYGIAAALLREPDGDRELGTLLEDRRVDLVVLAGYLRLVPAALVARYAGRIINVHPSLLPAFGGPGMFGRRVHRAVLEAGCRITGATVHLVDEVYDRGPVLAQWPVPIWPGDTAEMLAERVLGVEHLLLPRVVQRLAGRRHPTSSQRVDGPARAAAFTMLGDPSGASTAVEALLDAVIRTWPAA